MTSRTWSRLISHPWLRDTDRELLFDFTGFVKYVPIVLGGGLFASTIALTAWGPIDWQFDNAPKVYTFLCACLVVLVLGYVIAVRDLPARPRTRTPPLPASLVVVTGSVVYLLLYPLTTYEATGRWYPDVYRGLVHSGQAYADKIAAGEHLHQYATYLGMLVGPLTICVLPLTLFCYPRLSRPARVLGVLVILLSVALGVAQAVNKDVGEVCGFVLLFLVIVGASSRGLGPDRLRRIGSCAVTALFVCVLFLAYYSTVIHHRVATDVTVDTGKPATTSSTNSAMETNALHNLGIRRGSSPFYEVVPARAQANGIMLTSYLTQGYKGLSLAMDSPWHPTWGLGFSIFVRHNAARVLGLDESSIEARTYEGEIDARGWAAGAQWSSFFIHPASDITFPGVVLLMGLIGYGFGVSWRDTCMRRDPLACTVFVYLMMLTFYLSANNQLYQQGRIAIGFTAVLVAWLTLRNRRRSQSTPVSAERVTTSG